MENEPFLESDIKTTNPIVNSGISVNNIFGVKRKQPPSYIKTDRFYIDIYEYYYKGGYFTILTSNITEILSLIFGILFSIFIFNFLDWEKIVQCGNNNDIKDCGDISLYINPHTPNILFVIVLFVSCMFTVCKIFIFIYEYKNLLYIHNFYKDILKISTKELKTMSWGQIIYILSRNNISINDITGKILRKDNYLIAMIDNNILTFHPQFYTKQLEMNLQYIILDNLENLDSTKLKKKFILYGIVNTLLSFFIFIYILLHFVASNIDEFYTNASKLASRKYCLISYWKFRNYNELKHFSENRINKSVKYANEYIKQFQSPVMEVVGKFVCLISGALIWFFIVLSLLDESILLYVRLFDRSLLFYMGVIGAISATARGYIKTPENRVYKPNSSMKKIIEYVHHIPSSWNGKYHTYKIRDEFLSMFPYILVLFLYNLISVVTTPLILLFVLPERSAEIVNFIKINTIETCNIGKICNFSEFKNNDKNDFKIRKSMSSFFENHSVEDDNTDSSNIFKDNFKVSNLFENNNLEGNIFHEDQEVFTVDI